MVEDLLVGAVVKAIELSPAVGVLIWAAWRADYRAQRCIDKLLDLLELARRA
jgi:hypothetical protein